MQENKETPGASKTFWIIMIVGILAFGGLLTYFLLQPTPPPQEVRLQNAVREGSPEFNSLRQKIAVQENRDFTTDSRSTIGGIQMNLVAIVRNFTGKTLTGLEVVASVIDENGGVIKEKTAIVIPSGQISKIENNNSGPITVIISGFSPQDKRADFKFRVTGIKVE